MHQAARSECGTKERAASGVHPVSRTAQPTWGLFDAAARSSQDCGAAAAGLRLGPRRVCSRRRHSKTAAFVTRQLLQSYPAAVAHPAAPALACKTSPPAQRSSPWGALGVMGARLALAVRLSGLPLPPAAASAAASPLARPARVLALPRTSVPASQAAVANATHTSGDSRGTRVMATRKGSVHAVCLQPGVVDAKA